MTPPAGDPPDPLRPISPAPDERERARFLRPQPPVPIPERVRPQPLTGLLAQELLGARVYRGSR